MGFYKKYIYSQANKFAAASKSAFFSLFGLEIASNGRLFHLFPAGSSNGYRLPNNIILVFILIINIAVLSFATYTVLSEIEKRLSRMAVNVMPQVEDIPKKVKPEKKKNSIVLDNFNKVSQNRFGGNIAVLNSYGGSCVYSIVVLPDEPQKVLEISYDVSPPSSYCGYITSLNGIDLSNYRLLSFELKGETGDEIFKIELSDGEFMHSLSVSQILPRGLSEKWHRVAIPLSSFSSVRNWENMEGNLAILFENSQGMPYKGRIYIRDLKFLIIPD